MSAQSPSRNGPRAGRRSAFSLIEVLIGVMVLSLGLLGLGMVFPVVVRQQRQAQDSIQGISTVRSASSYLLGRTDLFNPGNPGLNTLWGYASSKAIDETKATGAADDFHRWQTPDAVTNVSPGSSVYRFVVDRAYGQVVMTYISKKYDDSTPPILISSVPVTSTIAIAERLFPKPFSSPAEPLFVWDFAVRQSGRTNFQVAVFSRRVDPGIRIPAISVGARHMNLSNVLTGDGLVTGVEKASRRVPVAVDSVGRPTLNGADENNLLNYSPPRTIRPAVKPFLFPSNVLEFDPDADDNKRIDARDAALIAAALQPGQKLVDNRGTIHTVLRPGDAVNTVVLERTMSPDLLRDLGREPVNPLPSPNPRPVNFVLTPQVPAAVTVLTLPAVSP